MVLIYPFSQLHTYNRRPLLDYLAYNGETVKAYEGNRTENCFLIGMFLGQLEKCEGPREKWDPGSGSGGEGIVAKATNQRW